MTMTPASILPIMPPAWEETLPESDSGPSCPRPATSPGSPREARTGDAVWGAAVATRGGTTLRAREDSFGAASDVVEEMVEVCRVVW